MKTDGEEIGYRPSSKGSREICGSTEAYRTDKTNFIETTNSKTSDKAAAKWACVRPET